MMIPSLSQFPRLVHIAECHGVPCQWGHNRNSAPASFSLHVQNSAAFTLRLAPTFNRSTDEGAILSRFAHLLEPKACTGAQQATRPLILVRRAWHCNNFYLNGIHTAYLYCQGVVRAIDTASVAQT